MRSAHFWFGGPMRKSCVWLSLLSRTRRPPGPRDQTPASPVRNSAAAGAPINGANAGDPDLPTQCRPATRKSSSRRRPASALMRWERDLERGRLSILPLHRENERPSAPLATLACSGHGGAAVREPPTWRGRCRGRRQAGARMNWPARTVIGNHACAPAFRRGGETSMASVAGLATALMRFSSRGGPRTRRRW